MIPRPSTGFLVGALIRKAEVEGGFAAVLCKGDANSGSLLVVLTEKGTNPRIYERLLAANGTYSWQLALAPDPANSQDIQGFIERRRRFDPDLWAIELDIASADRFTADMNSDG